ncbi:peptidylprolyl isomerase [bacterium]|nr:peptidylprolyl isomerase [bacterium]
MRRIAAPLIGIILLASACGSDDAADQSGGAILTTTTIAAPATTAGDPDAVAGVGNTVSVHYTGTLDDGSQFDSSAGREPLQFEIGAGEVIPGFDDAVTGLKVGDTVTVRLTPEEAYGEHDPANVQDVPLDQLPEGVNAGDELVSPIGAVVVVQSVDADSAIIDFNPPLAGQALTFEIALVSIDA